MNKVDVIPNAYGHYQILSLLGEGGSGKTYLAFDSNHKVEVAMKVLKLRGISNWKVFEMFEREANR
jgi:eukaryotic-like serine/threonine-protein kinase